MKAIMLTLIASAISMLAFSQNDKIYKHDGEVQDVKILKVNEFTISYSYPGETAEQMIGKYAVAKIGYASGRNEQITEKVSVSGASDWEKVMVIEDKSAIIGLKNVGEVRGKTSGMMGLHTAGSADRKSMKKLKESAAEMGASFVLITSEKDNQFTTQSIKRGFGYSYK